MKRVEVETGAETLLTGHEGRAEFDGAFAPDGQTVYLSSNKDRDLRAFARIRLGKGGPGPIEIVAERADYFRRSRSKRPFELACWRRSMMCIIRAASMCRSSSEHTIWKLLYALSCSPRASWMRPRK